MAWISRTKRCLTRPERLGSGTWACSTKAKPSPVISSTSARGSRIYAGRRRPRSDRQEQVRHAVGIVAVSHGHLDREPDDLVTQRPVHEVAGDERAVRDDDVLIVAVDDGGCSDVDAVDLAVHAGNRHDVAHPDRSFQQQNDTANEAGYDFLETEAETHAERGEHDADLVEPEVDCREPGEESEAET